MADKRNPINETDDEARSLARSLVDDTRYVALAFNEGESGYPLVSRVAAAFTPGTGLFFCASDLSVHSKCLSVDQRCSVLSGEPGKGDGLAYPRITLIGTVQRTGNSSPSRQILRDVFVKHHPKSKLYVDFADFAFYRLNIERAQLNGGFGKAFHLNGDDLKFLHEWTNFG